MVALALILATSAFAEDVGESIKRLQRLEATCAELTGPDLPKMLSATMLEAVRLYQGENYEPALDSILLAFAIHPKETPVSFYGVQPGRVEVKVRQPSDDEKKLLPVNQVQYSWVMVAVANISDVKMDLTSISASISDARVQGKVYKSIGIDDPAAEKALGEKKGFLLPGSVNPGETATFVMLFPAFTEWAEFSLLHDAGRINLQIKNYPVTADVTRHMKASKAAAAILEKHRALAKAEQERIDKLPKAVKPKPGEKAPPEIVTPKKDEYILIGYIRNEILAGKYGIQLLQGAKVAGETQFFVRIGQQNVAELKPIGSGTIAELTGGFRVKPSPGNSVYIKKSAK